METTANATQAMYRTQCQRIAKRIIDGIAARAAQKYPNPKDLRRIQRATEIMTTGGCRQLDEHTWNVASQNGTVEAYRVTRKECPCKDAQYSTSPCKHRFAVKITAQAQGVMDTAQWAYHEDRWGVAWNDQGWQFLPMDLPEVDSAVCPVEECSLIMVGDVFRM